MIDLYSNQYDYETLKANIYVVSLIDVLKTQKLTADFCVKYILNTDFQLRDEEETITISMVKTYQPHILDIDFVNAIIRATNKKLKGERIDSIEDFESYMNRHI
jgi:hypothetical protein